MKRSAVVAIGLVVLIVAVSGAYLGGGIDAFPGVGSDGGGLPEGVSETHQSALTESESFTMTYSVTQTQSAGEQEVTSAQSGVYWVDGVNDRAIAEITVQGQTRSQYTGDGSTHLQVLQNESVSTENATYFSGSEPYEGQIQPVNTSVATGSSLLLTEQLVYEQVGSDTRDGVSVTVYDVDSEASKTAFNEAQGENSSATIDAVNGTLTIDASGVVRSYSVTVSVSAGPRTTTETVELNVASVDSTTVEEPGWVSIAEEQSNEPPANETG